jgi:BASS family bile acid:Na+ symporter
LETQALALLIMTWSVKALIFGLGLNVRFRELFYLWAHPARLVKAFLAMFVLVPLVALAIGYYLPVSPTVQLLLLVLTICAGAPALPNKLMKAGGDQAYVYSLLVNASLISILIIPFAASYIGQWWAKESDEVITTAMVGQTVALSFVLPLCLGILVQYWFPAVADRLSEPIISVFGTILLVLALIMMVFVFPKLAALNTIDFVAIALFALISLAVGFALGGPELDDRFSLALSSAVRHVGLSLIITLQYFPKSQLLPALLAYLLVVQLVVAAFSYWYKRRYRVQG